MGDFLAEALERELDTGINELVTILLIKKNTKVVYTPLFVYLILNIQ